MSTRYSRTLASAALCALSTIAFAQSGGAGTGTGAAPTGGTGAMSASNPAPGNGGDPVRTNPDARSGAAPATVTSPRATHHRMKAPKTAASAASDPEKSTSGKAGGG